MTASDQKNVFISHIHEDDHELPRLKSLIERHGMKVRDGSINSDKPNNATSDDYIKYQILAPRIRWSSTLVVLINHGTANSAYVNWEIEYAASLGKNVVGVFAAGATAADIPPALEACGDAAVVGWRGERIVEAIEGKTTEWQNPATGEQRTPTWTIVRYSCA